MKKILTFLELVKAQVKQSIASFITGLVLLGKAIYSARMFFGK